LFPLQDDIDQILFQLQVQIQLN